MQHRDRIGSRGTKGPLLGLLVVAMPLATGCQPTAVASLVQALVPLLVTLVSGSGTPTTPGLGSPPSLQGLPPTDPGTGNPPAASGTDPVNWTELRPARPQPGRVRVSADGVSATVDVPAETRLVWDQTGRKVLLVSAASPQGQPVSSTGGAGGANFPTLPRVDELGPVPGGLSYALGPGTRALDPALPDGA